MPEGELGRLRDSLVTLLMQYGREEGMQMVQTQLALALAAFCAHVPLVFWSPMSCVRWLAERFCQENDVASVTCLMEILIVLPEEAHSRRIGLHPKRRAQYVNDLQEEFSTVLQILEK